MKRSRPYVKVRRAAAEAGTRARIVEALMELHAEVGPSRTTVSAVADRAGVERLTVYRHFPDETAMLRACSARWSELHPLPAPFPANGVAPIAAARRTIAAVYAWYRANEPTLANVLADAARIRELHALTAPLRAYAATTARALDVQFPRRNARRRVTLQHALEFSTWQSLARLTGSDRRAADIAVSWIGEN